jgi:cytochrome c-type biogenesis protein CcmH
VRRLRPAVRARRRALVAIATAALWSLASLGAAAQAPQPGFASGARAETSLEESAILGPPRGTPLAGAELDQRTRALGELMRCPVCQGMSIADSPSSSALAMVSEVRHLLERGYTEQQVLDYFVRSYGEFVLLEPTAEGFNLVVWLLPLAGVLAGALLIGLRLRAASARRRAAARAGVDEARVERGTVAPLDSDLDRYLERVRSEVVAQEREVGS